MTSGEVMSDAVQRAFERLRREYLDEMPQRLADLAAAAAAGDEPALRIRVHQLAGSGGSHGFPEISDAARAVEAALGRAPGDPARDAAVEAGLSRLQEAVRRARESLPPAHP
jgi:HPt (histidine-containing phosphotransfer) domain-containing protein